MLFAIEDDDLQVLLFNQTHDGLEVLDSWISLVHRA